MKPLIKWPGGKSGELDVILAHLPRSYERYVEPFFGGGALFFSLQPERALINDSNPELMNFYRLVKEEPARLAGALLGLEADWQNLTELLDRIGLALDELLEEARFKLRLPGEENAVPAGQGKQQARALFSQKEEELRRLLYRNLPKELLLRPGLDLQGLAARMASNLVLRLPTILFKELEQSLSDPARRLVRQEQFLTCLKGGYYYYLRDDYHPGDAADQSARFYFLREYCFGSMFRYNKSGFFNVPYGGTSYNRKSLKTKIKQITDPKVQRLVSGTELLNQDYTQVLGRSTSGDFIFLDPPYDTRFKKYGGREFTAADQRQLAGLFFQLPGKALLVIKKTELVDSLYRDHPGTSIVEYSLSYQSNFRNRHSRETTHLLIRNYREICGVEEEAINK